MNSPSFVYDVECEISRGKTVAVASGITALTALRSYFSMLMFRGGVAWRWVCG